jgi:DNA (cytosine-5)-methyltransferase 1
LVAITQTSVVGKMKRRITPREAARLQSFPDTFEIHPIDKIAYKQFGNSVNVDVVKYLCVKLMELSSYDLEVTNSTPQTELFNQ